MTLTARYVWRPRGTFYCSDCGQKLAEHIYMYGWGEREKPWALRLCVRHIYPETKDPKVRRALDQANADNQRKEQRHATSTATGSATEADRELVAG